METISYQEELSPALPTVVGNVDYQEFRGTLLRIDEILRRSGAERRFIDERIAAYRKTAEENGPKAEAVRPGELAEAGRQASQVLRCNIARELLGESTRGFSARLADSPLLQRFCGIARLEVIRVPSKSTIDRYGKLVDEQAVRKVIDQISRAAAEPARRGKHPLGLEKPLDLEAYFLDTTCVEAHIHFPTDWVLLRDAARTLIKAIRLIRRHASRYRDLLAERWADTELSWAQACQVLDRMDRFFQRRSGRPMSASSQVEKWPMPRSF